MSATTPLEQIHRLLQNYLAVVAGPLDIRMWLGQRPIKRFSGASLSISF
jgi:hypothetical protein